MLHPHEPTTQKQNKQKKTQTKNLIELRARSRFRNKNKKLTPSPPWTPHTKYALLSRTRFCPPSSWSSSKCATTFPIRFQTTPHSSNQQTTTTKKSASSDFDDDIDFDPDDLTILLHFFRKLWDRLASPPRAGSPTEKRTKLILLGQNNNNAFSVVALVLHYHHHHTHIITTQRIYFYYCNSTRTTATKYNFTKTSNLPRATFPLYQPLTHTHHEHEPLFWHTVFILVLRNV